MWPGSCQRWAERGPIIQAGVSATDIPYGSEVVFKLECSVGLPGRLKRAIIKR